MRLLELLNGDGADDDASLEQLTEEQLRTLLERTEFKSGRVERPDLNDADDLPKKQANVVSQLLGPKTVIEFGTAETDGTQGWFDVSLEKDFNSTPTVIGVIEHRNGEFQAAEYEPPEQSSPFTDTNSSIPSFADRLENNFKETSRDMGSSFYDVGADAIDSALPGVPGVNLSGGLKDVIDILFTETLGAGSSEKDGEAPVESLMGFLGETIGESMEEGFREKANEIENAVRNDVGGSVDSLAMTGNMAFGSLSNHSQAAINDSPKLLYESLGLPENARVAPLMIRNVDANSFEFLGFGSKDGDGESSGQTQTSTAPQPAADLKPIGGGGGSDDGSDSDGGDSGDGGSEDGGAGLTGDREFGTKDLEFDPMTVHYVAIGEGDRGIGDLFS